MTPRPAPRPPTGEEVFWAAFTYCLVALFALVVVVRPLYDLLMGY